jgi:hypothetical protein
MDGFCFGRQFCSALSYILTQDTRLATVFAANFLNNLQKAIIDYRTEFKKSVYFLVEVATTLAIRTT